MTTQARVKREVIQRQSVMYSKNWLQGESMRLRNRLEVGREIGLVVEVVRKVSSDKVCL